MKFPKQIWDQLRGKTCGDLISALLKDGWAHDETRGAVQVYRRGDGERVTIHYHPNTTYGPSLLKALIADIGWSVDDMRRLKLVK